MGRFWRENWVWIVGPIVVAVIVLTVILLCFGGDESSPFIYPIF